MTSKEGEKREEEEEAALAGGRGPSFFLVIDVVVVVAIFSLFPPRRRTPTTPAEGSSMVSCALAMSVVSCGMDGKDLLPAINHRAKANQGAAVRVLTEYFDISPPPPATGRSKSWLALFVVLVLLLTMSQRAAPSSLYRYSSTQVLIVYWSSRYYTRSI